MRSPATRLALGATAWIALAVAAFLIVQSDRRQLADRAALHLFDSRVHHVAVALADLRTAQQAFVAPGQGHGFWASKADEFLHAVESGLVELQQAATTAEGRRSLTDAAEAMTELKSISDRARKELGDDQLFSSAGTVFTEGSETAKDVAARLEAARLAERSDADASLAAARASQSRTAAVAAIVSATVVLLLAWMPSKPVESERARADDAGPSLDEPGRADSAGARRLTVSGSSSPPPAAGVADGDLWLRDRLGPPPVIARDALPALKASAELCTDLNRVRAVDDLTALLERVAAAMDAEGLIVWVGKPGGPSLHPVLAHGYSSESMARMPAVARSGDNAAAAAYRTGALQIVLARPGFSSGALAAPMLTADGCIGALTAEINNGGEASDSVQAIASIVAAQLAGLLSASVATQQEDEPARVPA